VWEALNEPDGSIGERLDPTLKIIGLAHAHQRSNRDTDELPARKPNDQCIDAR
jgi:hypothetical protein